MDKTDNRFYRESGRLAVWYGSMPESNGKSNWTAILHNGDIASGITLDRSEYPDRVRYEADRARWLIGELAEEPFILDYDADKHSGYTAPASQPKPLTDDLLVQLFYAAQGDITQFRIKARALLEAK
jgi:hypothetical protein